MVSEEKTRRSYLGGLPGGWQSLFANQIIEGLSPSMGEQALRGNDPVYDGLDEQLPSSERFKTRVALGNLQTRRAPSFAIRLIRGTNPATLMSLAASSTILPETIVKPDSPIIIMLKTTPNSSPSLNRPLSRGLAEPRQSANLLEISKKHVSFDWRRNIGTSPEPTVLTRSATRRSEDPCL